MSVKQYAESEPNPMVKAAAGIRARGFLEKAPMPEGRERTPAPRMFLTGGRGIEGGREGETI